MCMTPLMIKTDEFGNIPVPCGKCPVCVKRRQSGWSFRLMQEDKNAESSMFVTLTYDTVHVPLTRNGFMSLDKRECQLFMKRLRFANPGRKLKYYLVGEYGGTSYRPHYHLILFNASIETIQPAWDKGSVHYGKVEGASIGYCLKYMCKTKRIPLHRNDDRIPEFGLMSKRLGASYLSDEMLKWHEADLSRMYCVLAGGQKISMPRYYKDKVYSKFDRQSAGLKLLQEKERRETAKNRLKIESGMSPEAISLQKVARDINAFKKMRKSQLLNNKI